LNGSTNGVVGHYLIYQMNILNRGNVGFPLREPTVLL
jgi:hypothetical protein